MNFGHQWFVFAVGFCYGIVIGTLIATKVLGW